MIKKKYPANTPEMKNKLSQQAKSRIVTDKKQSLCIKFDHSRRILPN